MTILKREGLNDDDSKQDLTTFVNKLLKMEIEPKVKVDEVGTQTDLKQGLFSDLDNLVKVSGAITNQLATIHSQSFELSQRQQMLIRNATAVIDFFELSKTSVKKITTQLMKMLEQQTFSQKMQENLINDLMDLAKLENSKFKIQREYFSLPKMMMNSFQILLG